MSSETQPKLLYTKQSSLLYRIIVAVILLTAGTAIVLATRGVDDSTPIAARRGLQGVSPGQGVTVVRQTPITVDLLEGEVLDGVNVPGFVGELFIDGVRIPEDQLQTIEGQRKLTFVPGPDKEFTEFSAGQLCASVRYWRQDLGEATAATYEWCFKIA